jgi:hypothetical protein
LTTFNVTLSPSFLGPTFKCECSIRQVLMVLGFNGLVLNLSPFDAISVLGCYPMMQHQKIETNSHSICGLQLVFITSRMLCKAFPHPQP